MDLATLSRSTSDAAIPQPFLKNPVPKIVTHLGNCLEVMPKEIGDQSIDMVFADLPYGSTYANWDKRLPMRDLWEEYERVTKPHAALIFTATQPFASLLVASRLDWFRCEWVWDKVHGANFANANRQPLKQHESVLVFSRKAPRYFPQKVVGAKNHVQGRKLNPNVSETRLINQRVADDLSGMKFPKTIVTFAKHSSQVKYHPTEKPVDMCRYFIRTYSEPGDMVLDNTMGSGSTGVGAVMEGRRFTGIELNETHFHTAYHRLDEARKLLTNTSGPRSLP